MRSLSVRCALGSFVALLRILPTRVRVRHGEEIESFFAELLDDAHRRAGTRGVLRAWLRSVADLLLSRDLERPHRDSPRRKGSMHFFDTLIQDLRLAVRNMVARPLTTLMAVGSLAVGMGVTVGIFTFADTILWQAWGFHEPDRVVQVFEHQERYLLPSWPTFREVEEKVDLFDGVLASQLDLFAMGGAEETQTLAGERVSDDYFRVLGLPPLLGRYPASGDAVTTTLPVVISHYTWANTFGGTDDIIGRDVRLNGYSASVVAVAPEALEGTKWGVGTDLWVPMRAWATVDGWTGWEDDSGLVVTLMARMREGVDIAAVDAALASLTAGLQETRPDRYQGVDLQATDRLRGDMGPTIGMTSDIVAIIAVLAGVLVLLVGCGNVASLLLARGVMRTREVAVRYALGASRSRVVRQFLTESLLLAGIATVVGVFLASYGTAALVALLPTFDFRVPIETQPGSRSLIFATGLALFTVVASGLAPALRLSRTNLTDAMRTSGGGGLSGGRSRLLGTVVVGMVGASVLALFLAGVFGRTLSQGSAMEPGFATEDRVMAVVPLRLAGHRWQEATALFEDLERRLAALPGAVSVGYGTGVPLGESWTTAQVYGGDRAYPVGDPGTRSFRSSVSDNYFEAMGTRIVRGRTFGPQDGPEGPWVAILNEELAERLWPGEDPIGMQIRFGLGEDAEPVEVIGVAETGMYYMAGESPEPAVFASFRQWPQAQALVVIEAEGDPLDLVPGMRAELAASDPDVPLQRVRTSELHFQGALWLHRLGANIGGVVALLALLLSAAGLYGVMSFTLGARRHEFGIRRALGAGRPAVVRLALSGALRLTGLGLGVGVLLSVLVGGALRASLAWVEPWDPAVLVAVGIFVLAVGAVSGLGPGISAARVDPARALKSEN